MMHRFLILGLGQTGWSCAQALQAVGAFYTVYDNRLMPPCYEAFKSLGCGRLVLGEWHDDLCCQHDVCIISQGLSYQKPPVSTCLLLKPCWSDVELFQYLGPPKTVVAITGTNGKSTVTTWVGHVLGWPMGGNLGPPVMHLWMKGVENCILEVSNFQLELTHTFSPTISCCLNIAPDHLGRYSSYDAYRAVKQKVHDRTTLAVALYDDSLTYPSEQVPCVTFGITHGDYHVKNNFLMHHDRPLLPITSLYCHDAPTLNNALATWAICAHANLSNKEIAEKLVTYRGLSHRLEYVGYYHHLHWVNDSKGTNVAATCAALHHMVHYRQAAGRIIWLAGGKFKEQHLKGLSPFLKDIKIAIFFGTDGEFLKKLSNVTSSYVVATLQEAIEMVRFVAFTDDWVLLSPACASTDQFQDFEHRGICFKQWINDHSIAL
jgi:UDP-N-acetylmuramoylalanine--D-glutamate ligase